MFTGIIEEIGIVSAIQKEEGNIHFAIESQLSAALKIDQSVAHNGCCLTVVELNEGKHTVTAIHETLAKTNLSDWKVGSKINLERCMSLNGRLDGHIVQGHVDGLARCVSIIDEAGSWRYRFEYDADFVTVEKGSITVNGASLTVVDSEEGAFSVCIIPYTYEHTNFHSLKVGDEVNLEFDIIGKYVARLLQR
ncbi:MAG: riboflavin synthase [Crocinitomicaceae bacterium]|jgi:riboflavin synthase|nr:riboflavin synthase [Crocinitomicaceae bacterium]MDP4760588.1 riboflavin synthase [Crocinitomicaceae bacterium]